MQVRYQTAPTAPESATLPLSRFPTAPIRSGVVVLLSSQRWRRLRHDVKGHLASIVVQHLFKEDFDGRTCIS
jgi:hypothetical protein